MKAFALTFVAVSALAVGTSAFASSANTRGAHAVVDARKSIQQNDSAYALTGERETLRRVIHASPIQGGRNAY